MKNNKGFTLIELLAVIVLLAVIATIAVPSIMGISRKTKEQMLETKKDLILEAAKVYGQDILSDVASSKKVVNLDGKDYVCKRIGTNTLLNNGYIKEENFEEADGDICRLINPVDNTCIDMKPILLYIKNKRVVAIFEDEDFDGTREYSCKEN